MDRIDIGNGLIAAAIKLHGAEPCSLSDQAGREFLWQAGPAWPRHAPLLFPIVGRLKDDRLQVDGRDYPMKQHGFARDLPFALKTQDEASCTLILEDSEATRKQFPFAFRLEASYRLEGTTFTAVYVATNTGPDVLPASLGAHPAFSWPLLSGLAKDQHRLVFEQEENGPLAGIVDGLLGKVDRPSPIEGRVLSLREEIFARDALVLPAVKSQSVRFEAPGAPALRVAWDNAPELGLWMKPGADFLCIEPWHGFASPVDFDGPFTAKPGLWLIPPGESRQMSWSASIEAA
ncbi:Galactose mutarotase [Arboricoccus pini]|uniref:Galactose mutarotase n=1 Tax=Arboricoccus pini TaxID=1963835 RepID=A0A212RG03_9PROT|nr:aldose 1-epimerase family protein [Arboricoccus pini]SNB71277.1 Galactose mutarotase [Arboricoccus pini]